MVVVAAVLMSACCVAVRANTVIAFVSRGHIDWSRAASTSRLVHNAPSQDCGLLQYSAPPKPQPHSRLSTLMRPVSFLSPCQSKK